jgi:hypothetical protein
MRTAWRPEHRAWEEWAADDTHLILDIPGRGPVERRREVTRVSLPFVSFRYTYRFPVDGAMVTSDSCGESPAPMIRDVRAITEVGAIAFTAVSAAALAAPYGVMTPVAGRTLHIEVAGSALSAKLKRALTSPPGGGVLPSFV